MPDDRVEVQDWLAAQAAARPDGLALIIPSAGEPGPTGHPQQQWTYSALHAEVAHFAARLAALGIGRGARVGVLLASSLHAVLTIHAAMRLGAVLVLLNTRLTARELDGLLQEAACTLLLCDRTTAATALALQRPLQRVAVDDAEGSAEADALPEPIARLPVVASAAAHGDPDDQGGVRGPDDPAVILFTSGTTGTPRGAVLSAANLFAAALASAYRIGVLPDDRWLCSLPLYHIGGLSILLRSCLYGTAVELWPRFDADAVSQALAQTPITLISLVPTMLTRLLDTGLPAGPPLALRLVLLGGAAAPPPLVERALRAGMPVATTYGLTEATSQVATALPAAVAAKPGSVGRPLLFTQVRIVDAAGEPLPPGQAGEIVVGGPTVLQGYLNQPPTPRDAAGVRWFATGDIGYLDAAGDLWIVQRRHDIIISGGENIYPAEVEAVLQAHPAVAAAAVCGVPSPEWGQQVAALVVLREPTATAADLLAFARHHLAGYKQPRRLRFAAALPHTATGKLDRVALRRLLEDATDASEMIGNG